ncbi:3-hydroxyacyl-[acyl-carrier-protein] dehydratase [Luteibacter sp. W1I16]|uniref:hydroxymyristoyl-ACP dehydratase n=1 Tax=Luteibacter sp. W1I16 TaxID=3373922 RepID=UPI003D1F19C9
MTDPTDIAPCVRPLRFDAAHPSFAGHFPGRPIVAGVLLLEAVASALREWRGLAVRQVIDAKFLAPLLPEEDAEIELAAIDGARFRFTIRRATETLARGTIEGAA